MFLNWDLDGNHQKLLSEQPQKTRAGTLFGNAVAVHFHDNGAFKNHLRTMGAMTRGNAKCRYE